ncbi:hypothetical protein RJ639_045702 [Escallonia herrerae]|uniref:Uncharacterized protein n=1 Tax=Escallonia herrerae TaxID=1293975 RepID=A0AA88W863_9ASTE|nr:hypothetical protein RJ639_045702 [Escallonia herrerae]
MSEEYLGEPVTSETVMQKGHSSLLSFTVTDINTVSKLMALGAELDGPFKYEIHGKGFGSGLPELSTAPTLKAHDGSPLLLFVVDFHNNLQAD